MNYLQHNFVVHSWRLVMIVMLTCAGCGDSGPPRVQGTVTVNGVPVKQGEIRFVSIADTNTDAAGIVSDGAFSIEAALGSNRVEIQSYENAGMKPIDPAMPGSAMVPVLKPLLPPKYNSASELTLEVSGDMDHDFNLSLP